MSLFMAGAEGLEPSARGFGVNPWFKEPRALNRTVKPFLELCALQFHFFDAFLMLFQIFALLIMHMLIF